MYVRVISGAFLIEGNDYLLMKRADNKKIAPGMWGGVGGHVEPKEINSPKAACLREIYEETGLEERYIENLDLRYIVLRRNKAEITMLYYFIGFVRTRYFEDKTQEGKLSWINESELLNREMSFELRNILEHYIQVGNKSSNINVGVISLVDNKPTIGWNSLDAWEGIIGV